MYSRDGTNWSIPDAYHSIIDFRPMARTESNFGFQAYTATSMVESNGQLYIYYSYFPQNHNSGNSVGEWRNLSGHAARGSVEGIQSTAGSCRLVDHLGHYLSSNPGHLIVNAPVGGSLKVEVLDASTLQPLAGFSLTDTTASTRAIFSTPSPGGPAATR